MTKDYKSFSSVAKSRFRGMAKKLGYEQVTGIIYVKEREGWYEGFSLQASAYGNDFFYINYGIIVPNLDAPFKEEIDIRNEGYILSSRLHNGYEGCFPNSTKTEVEESARIALQRYQEQAVPWFSAINGLKDIAAMYFDTTNLDLSKLGEHPYGSQYQAAGYGELLWLAGEKQQAIEWLKEAERLMSLPVYFTRDGRLVHEREKYARIMKKDKYDVKSLNEIRQLIMDMNKCLTKAKDD